MADGATVNPIDDDTLEKWRERQRKLLDEIQKDMEYYSFANKQARMFQRVISMAIMIGGAIAPVLVLSSNQGDGSSRMTDIVHASAVALTVLLAILEGTRRIFRFEQRWTSCFAARWALKKAREAYRDKIISLKIGSQAWIDALAELRASHQKVIEQQSSNFFEGLKEAGGPAHGNAR